MKSFSKSTILGLAFGILLAGYAVFAYTPPTQVPPDGNVAAPLNVGGDDQTKTGGMLSVFDFWVDSALGVTGGATFGGNVSWAGTLTGGSVPWARLSSVPAGFADGVDDVGGSIPTGAVMYFDLPGCPSGWSPYGAATGRYIVGGGTLGTVVGTQLGDGQDRAVGQHSHSISDPGHLHNVFGGTLTGGAGGSRHTWAEIGVAMTGRTASAGTGINITNNAGSVAGTNAPYLQLLVCKKN